MGIFGNYDTAMAVGVAAITAGMAGMFALFLYAMFGSNYSGERRRGQAPRRDRQIDTAELIHRPARGGEAPGRHHIMING